MMLTRDIYWFIFSIIKCPKTFIRLSLANNALQQIAQDERLQKKFIIRGKEQRSDFDEYSINLLTNNDLHGTCIKRWENNNLLKHSCEYKNNKLNGRSIEYHNDGILSSIATYKDGYLNGKYKSWFLEGELHLKTTYINDKVHGLFESWFRNGERNESVIYENGIRKN